MRVSDIAGEIEDDDNFWPWFSGVAVSGQRRTRHRTHLLVLVVTVAQPMW